MEGFALNLDFLGWNDFFASSFESLKHSDASLIPGRVARELRGEYLVLGRFVAPSGENVAQLTAQVAGRMRYQADARDDLPAVGDWVAVQPRPEEGTATIQAVLPRRAPSRQTEAAPNRGPGSVGQQDTVYTGGGLGKSSTCAAWSAT
jgi:ribosome biogenesis GTPase